MSAGCVYEVVKPTRSLIPAASPRSMIFPANVDSFVLGWEMFDDQQSYIAINDVKLTLYTG